MTPQTDRILYVDFQPQAKRKIPLQPKLRIVSPSANDGLSPKKNRFANPGQNPALTHALQNFRRRLQECDLALNEITQELDQLQAQHKAMKAEMKASSARAKAISADQSLVTTVVRPVSGKHRGKKSWQVFGSVRETIRQKKGEKTRLTKQKFDLVRDIQFLETQRELQFQQYIDSLVSAQQPVAGVEAAAELDSGADELIKAIV